MPDLAYCDAKPSTNRPIHGGSVTNLTRAVLIALSAGAVQLIMVSYVVYIRQQHRKEVKPEPVGWFISGVGLTTNCIMQLAMGATWWSSATIAVQAAGSFTIMALSIRSGNWRITKLDAAVLIVAPIALLYALAYGETARGTIMMLIADSAGMLVIIRNAACIPDAERALAWVISMMAGPPTILAVAITGGGLMLYLLPVYLMAVDGAVVVAVYVQRAKQRRAQMVLPIDLAEVAAA